VNQEQP